jgi:uncharacterized protein (DUF433 family)
MKSSSSYIETHPEKCDGRPCIRGTRVRVQDIYAMSELRGQTPDEIVRSLPHLTLAQVHAALAYYFEHRDAILSDIREDETFVRDFRALTGPGPLERKLQEAATQCDPVSP